MSPGHLPVEATLSSSDALHVSAHAEHSAGLGHALVPDGVFVAEEGKVRFEELGPPTQEEVERLLSRVHRRVLRLLERRGALPAQGPEDALQAWQAHSLRQRLFWPKVEGQAG